jgi:nicotinate-nucleotide adenylyltransferase
MRTGILGGTFDPVHFGHLFIAEAVRARARLNRVLFLPVGEPAHRGVYAPAAHRKAMVALAIAGNPKFELDDAALTQAGPVYTADTLPLLRKKYPRDEFHFIAGLDSLTVSTWRRLDEVAAALAAFYVVRREGSRAQDISAIIAHLPADLQTRFVIIDLPLVDVSATAIRERAKAGEPIRYLTPDAVVRYIESEKLYLSSR